MKIRVDQLKCGTAAICVREFPELFRFQPGSKKATVRVEEIPRHLEEKCRRVARKCPNKAIVIEP